MYVCQSSVVFYWDEGSHLLERKRGGRMQGCDWDKSRSWEVLGWGGEGRGEEMSEGTSQGH